MIGQLEYINYNDKLYFVYRKLKEGRVPDNAFEDIRILYNCDIVLKRKMNDVVDVIFLREISDAEIVTEAVS